MSAPNESGRTAMHNKYRNAVTSLCCSAGQLVAPLPKSEVDRVFDPKRQSTCRQATRVRFCPQRFKVGREMRPPFTVELWKPSDDTPHLLAVTEGFEAAETAYQEAVANLRVGEVVRVRDGLATVLLST